NSKKQFKNIMDEIQKAYNEILKTTSLQDARYVLPQAAETKMFKTWVLSGRQVFLRPCSFKKGYARKIKNQ
ncbi:FAD-dependent thymidylate synthase, partial [bacterium]|nr:FAD-dependent thymidylate synthase [bacterium]